MYNDVIAHIRELFKSEGDFIPLHRPLFISKEREYVLDAIDSTFVSSVGKYVDKFEEMMVAYTGAKYAVATVNGTAALHIALILSGVEKDTEVLMQPLTFIATANAVSYIGAVPHFVDVDADTLGLSPKKMDLYLENIVEFKNGKSVNKNTGREISACVPMHTFGLPLRIDELVKVCDKYNIPIVEDAAESLGSYYKGKHTGTFGTFGTFSFNGNKTITCGGGGAIVTDDERLAKAAKHITTTAKIPHRWEYRHDRVGYNYRMPNLNAAFACAQLEILDKYLVDKLDLANNYRQFFSHRDDIAYIDPIDDAKPNYWLNAIQLSGVSERNEFLTQSNDSKVMTRPIWKLMNHLEMFKNCPKSSLESSEKLEQTIVNIPSSVRQ